MMRKTFTQPSSIYIPHFSIFAFSHTVFFHLAPDISLTHYHISYFLMQALTSNLQCTKLLHNLLQYIFHTFASLLASHTVFFSLASHNYLKHITISCSFLQALTSNP